MNIRRRRVLEVLAAGAAGLIAKFSHARQPAPVMLADVYKGGIPLSEYAVSEKYDGLRGYCRFGWAAMNPRLLYDNIALKGRFNG